MLRWRQFSDEVPGRRVDNVWPRVSSIRGKKRYVVQVADAIVERCVLMTTDPGDLVLDPTCGSGVTADVAEEWGRRWITIDVSRVALAVARQHLATSAYSWHRTLDGGNDPAAGFVCRTMPKVSAGRLADPDTDWEHPDNVIRLVDQTDKDAGRVRLCSPFTVESHSPYSYLPFSAPAADSGAGRPARQADLGLAAGDAERAVIEALHRSPICDSGGRTLLAVVDHERWPEGRLATHGVTCVQPGRDTEIAAALMIAAPDATVTAELVKRAVVEARRNVPDCRNLIVVGFAFDPDVPAAVNVCNVHRVVGSKDLQIPELSKSPDAGTFTLLGEPDCEVRRTSDGTGLVVRLNGCDTYDPGTGIVRETRTDDIDCWMVDTDHDSLSFIARLTYFPNGVRNRSGLKAAMRSLAKDLDPDAEANLTSLLSQPFDIPGGGRPVAVKAITRTGAEMNAVIHPDAWRPADE
ncbi:MAG: site-specific DNA-methyltransferase [Acidimicrobiaceae bacterium]|nr:site-specific DNA-methyltransferase [Acidimicrobiaceae bacterium]